MVKITSKQDQAKGVFAGGAILENKPIGFPQDGGVQKPYSNLFYWANAWSDKGGLIGEHPHKMFEIMSVVLEGEIQHYDSKHKRWLSLNKGDAQIIRSGSGITHAERLLEGSRIFQIWFDPNIQETVSHTASYDDYKSEEMRYTEVDNIAVKNYTGNGGPLKMKSEGVEINQFNYPVGKYHLKTDDKIHSYYVLGGNAKLNGTQLHEHDFIVIQDEEVSLEVEKELELFEIATPKKLSYKTYRELVKF